MFPSLLQIIVSNCHKTFSLQTAVKLTLICTTHSMIRGMVPRLIKHIMSVFMVKCPKLCKQCYTISVCMRGQKPWFYNRLAQLFTYSSIMALVEINNPFMYQHIFYSLTPSIYLQIIERIFRQNAGKIY